MKSQVRIIGGRWRGRKLEVVDADGLRPTPDRIRETLFNWLAADCRDACVLDCFAGSGVLGFEAMSRGANRLLAIEQQSAAAAGLRAARERFAAPEIEIIQADARVAVRRLRQPFNLVFIDPPYVAPELRSDIFSCLERQDCLAPQAQIYFEWPRQETFVLPSPRLQWRRQQHAGQVNYAIAEWRVSG